jgi:hypothetical protein
MIWAATIVLAVCVLATSAVVLVSVLKPRRRRNTLIAKQVVVQLVDGSAVAGVLTREVPGFYIVENARHHESGASVLVDGAAWLPNERVAWVQVGNWQDGGEQ